MSGIRKYRVLPIRALTRLYTRSILGAHPLESMLKAGKQRVKTGYKMRNTRGRSGGGMLLLSGRFKCYRPESFLHSPCILFRYWYRS
jgi:hypothetical protein